MLVPLAVAAGKLAVIPREGTGRGPGTRFPLPVLAFFPLLCPAASDSPGSTFGCIGSSIPLARVAEPTSMGLLSPR